MRSAIVIPALLAGAVLVGACAHPRPVTAKVTGKENKCFKSNDCRNMVNTDQGNFQVTDTGTRHDSYDVYAKIEVGKTYDFTVIGDRNPTRSLFPNIIDVVKK